jgi:hypothetical protein
MNEHEQVPFRTVQGKWVGVDEGLEEILTVLRDNGIRTTYSCEGNYGQAYILFPMRDGFKFRRLIRGTSIGRKFDGGRRSIELSFFRDKGTNWVWKTIVRFKTRSGVRTRISFKTEHTISNHYGFRTTYRWPSQDTYELQAILKNLSRR